MGGKPNEAPNSSNDKGIITSVNKETLQYGNLVWHVGSKETKWGSINSKKFTKRIIIGINIKHYIKGIKASLVASSVGSACAFFFFFFFFSSPSCWISHPHAAKSSSGEGESKYSRETHHGNLWFDQINKFHFIHDTEMIPDLWMLF